MIKKREAHLLVSYLDDAKTFKFLLEKGKLFTLPFSYDPRFTPESQIKSFLAEYFGFCSSSEDSIKVKKEFRETFNEADKESILYFANLTIKPKFSSKFIAASFRELLLSLPKTKERLIFLKAFQVLSDDKRHLIEAHEVSRKSFLEKNPEKELASNKGL